MSAAKHPSISADEFLREVLTRMSRDESRAVDFYRSSELCPPFSKGWITRRIVDGDLDAVRIGGVVLVKGASLRRMLRNADTWKGKP